MIGKRSARPLFGIGGVTLLTVLLVLCLTMFAVLALSSAQADRRLSEKNADNVKAYYAADRMAVGLMLRGTAFWPGGAPRPAAEAWENGEDAGFTATVEEEGEGLLFSADIPAQESQILRVSLFLKPDTGGERWEIRQWQVFPTVQDEGDIGFLPVWQPQP